MALPAVDEIEQKFSELPTETQLGVLERLVHLMRTHSRPSLDSWATELSAMAADREVQAELRRIDDEFIGTELDGLEKR